MVASRAPFAGDGGLTFSHHLPCLFPSSQAIVQHACALMFAALFLVYHYFERFTCLEKKSHIQQKLFSFFFSLQIRKAAVSLKKPLLFSAFQESTMLTAFALHRNNATSPLRKTDCLLYSHNLSEITSSLTNSIRPHVLLNVSARFRFYLCFYFLSTLLSGSLPCGSLSWSRVSHPFKHPMDAPLLLFP